MKGMEINSCNLSFDVEKLVLKIGILYNISNTVYDKKLLPYLKKKKHKFKIKFQNINS